MHRKGATRAFGPGHEELSPLYKLTGQPVLVPGDMGRASYLMVGQEIPNLVQRLSWSWTRTQSRAISKILKGKISVTIWLNRAFM